MLRILEGARPWRRVEVTLAPLTTASRWVALLLGGTVVVLAGAAAIGVARPAYPNEAGVVALGFLLGALVAAWGLWKKEPAKSALVWCGIDVVLAGLSVAFAGPLGLA